MKRLGFGLFLGAVIWLLLTDPASGNHVVMHGGPFGGVVVQMLVHPQEPGTLYLASFGSGVFKSVDGGGRWVAMSRGLDDPRVLTLAMDPNAPRVLYAGTDSGVFVSRDAGATWGRTGRGLADRNVRSLAAVPARPPLLYAATDHGVWRSGNQGVTWTPRNAGLEALDIRVLRVDPARPDRLYAAGFGGVFRSEDGGRHWRGTNQGLTDRRVRALAIDPTRPEVVYAGTAGAGIFVATDGGDQWHALNEGLRNLTVLSLLATPRGERFAGTVGGVHRWDPEGAAWRLVGENVLSLTVTFVATNPHQPGVLYAGTGGLVFVSQDDGRQWRELAASVAGPSVAGSEVPGAQPSGVRPPAGAHSPEKRR